MPIVDLLFAAGTRTASRSVAKRVIEQGGVRLNGEKVGQDRTVTLLQAPLELRVEKRRAMRLE